MTTNMLLLLILLAVALILFVLSAVLEEIKRWHADWHQDSLPPTHHGAFQGPQPTTMRFSVVESPSGSYTFRQES